jgi:hypothetical protein
MTSILVIPRTTFKIYLQLRYVWKVTSSEKLGIEPMFQYVRIILGSFTRTITVSLPSYYMWCDTFT